MDVTHDGLVSFYEFMLFSSLLSKVLLLINSYLGSYTI